MQKLLQNFSSLKKKRNFKKLEVYLTRNEVIVDIYYNYKTEMMHSMSYHDETV